jgi:Helix-loop-helix DNA-binding domain
LTGQDKESLLANEKRRRRRESHNTVERRRDNISEKTSELATLMPECMLENGSGGSGNVNANEGNALFCFVEKGIV